MNIRTVQFAHILETSDLSDLAGFLDRTAFVISHKNESPDTLLKVLWYLPVNSPTIVVTNCQEQDYEELARALSSQLEHRRELYLIHQKDERLACFFHSSHVYSILGPDGKVVNGKGEGMYIGALLAYQLSTPRWVIFYDADNFVPSALLEYTMAMSRLFMSSPLSNFLSREDTLMVGNPVGLWAVPDLHNVRICWSSKPDMEKPDLSTRVLGRTTRVVSPLFTELIAGWFGILDHSIFSSNAGEQGMTMSTAATLRFSSGFSVETFHLLDLLFHAHIYGDRAEHIVLQQYLSQSPHFHEKKDDEHIKQMIEESLGCFDYFKKSLPANVSQMLDRLYTELDLSFRLPKVYPPLNDLPGRALQEFTVERYKLTVDRECSGLQEMLIAE